METLLSTKQVQDLLHLDRTTIYRMLKDGRLTGVKVGQQWRFSASEVKGLVGNVFKPEEPEALISTNALPLHCVQMIQNVIADITDISVVTIQTDGEPLTKISNQCEFCQLINASREGHKGCIASWRELGQRDNLKEEFITCHAGLQCTGAGITVRGNSLAVLVSGQFFIHPPDSKEVEARVQTLAKDYDIDAGRLSDAAMKIPVLSNRKKAELWRWLKQVARTFEDISNERANLMNRLKKIAEMSDFT